MDIFDLREQLVRDYGDFIRGFLKVRDDRLDEFVRRSLEEGVFWPEPYISLIPNFASRAESPSRPPAIPRNVEVQACLRRPSERPMHLSDWLLRGGRLGRLSRLYSSRLYSLS